MEKQWRRQQVALIVALVLALLVCFLGGCMVGLRVALARIEGGQSDGLFTNEVTHDEQYMRKLDYILTLIEQRHIDGLDYDALEDLLADAVIDATGDRWSYYLTAEEYQTYLEQFYNSYVGIGVTIQATENEQTGPFTVSAVTEGGPAEEAGVKIGDVLTAVDGTDTATLTLSQTQKLVRGTADTTVVLTVLRGDDTLQITVTRRAISVPVVQYEMLEGKLGYLQIDNFDTNCANETIAAIESLTEQGAQGLIFDLRFNPGGMKKELVEILDYLLPEGPLFHSVDYTGKTSTDYSDADFIDLPFVVLVNGDSYSAAEFFAAAIQEYEVGSVVGTRTVGKANYQQTYQLPDGSAVGISTGHYQTPKGVTLEGVGVTPDYVVELDEEAYTELYYGRLDAADDAQLQKAIEVLSGQIDTQRQ